MQGTVGELARKQNMLSPYTIKTTVTMLVSIPIICVYPALQRHFVKGIMIGAIKG